MTKSANKWLTNTKFVSFYINLFKAKITCFSFYSKIICLISLLWTLILLAFTRFCFISLIFLILTMEWFTSIILSENLRQDFCLTKKLKQSPTLLYSYLKFFGNCKTLLFWSLYNCINEVLYFNSLSFV